MSIRVMEEPHQANNQESNSNLFKNVPLAPPDPIFGTDIAFMWDSDLNKINLGNGVYRDHEGLPFVFPTVRKVEA